MPSDRTSRDVDGFRVIDRADAFATAPVLTADHRLTVVTLARPPHLWVRVGVGLSDMIDGVARLDATGEGFPYTGNGPDDHVDVRDALERCGRWRIAVPVVRRALAPRGTFAEDYIALPDAPVMLYRIQWATPSPAAEWVIERAWAAAVTRHAPAPPADGRADASASLPQSGHLGGPAC